MRFQPISSAKSERESEHSQRSHGSHGGFPASRHRARPGHRLRSVQVGSGKKDGRSSPGGRSASGEEGRSWSWPSSVVLAIGVPLPASFPRSPSLTEDRRGPVGGPVGGGHRERPSHLHLRRQRLCLKDNRPNGSVFEVGRVAVFPEDAADGGAHLLPALAKVPPVHA